MVGLRLSTFIELFCMQVGSGIEPWNAPGLCSGGD